MATKSTYETLVLNERPEGRPPLPVAGRTFRKKTSPVPTAADLTDGQVLLEILYLSLDPSQLGFMQGKAPSVLHTSPCYPIAAGRLT